MPHMVATQPQAEPELRVDLVHAPTLNFAMEQAGVPVVSEVRVSNTGSVTSSPLELVVRIDPQLAEPQIHALGAIRAGQSVELTALDLRLRAGRLRTVVEAERAEIVWELRTASGQISSQRSAIDVLAYNEWAGLRAPPALLASFVTPNDPVIASVLQRLREHMRKTTKDGSISGYQSRSEERVYAMVRALYETVQELGISYIGAPSSYEAIGQKVRFPEILLRESLGNCLDVTLLMASCLEQMGLSPLIVVIEGHAFPGVWLVDERFPECVVYDAARLRNAIELGQLTFFDSSATVAEPRVPFETAENVAKSAMGNDDAFLCAIDVIVARRDRYRPLPLRDMLQNSIPAASTTSGPAREILDQAATLPLVEREPVNDTRESGSKAQQPGAQDRFQKWREKLLDLSLRNKLLNFRDDAKGALRLEIPDIARFEDALLADETFEVHGRPTDARDERSDKLVRAHGGDDARKEGLLRDLEKKIVHSPVTENELLKQATIINRAARLAIEEGGANVLYVVFGVLKWYEAESSTTERYAPLLLVPISLEHVRSTGRAQLRHLAEESLPNQTLIEKMRIDFGVDLSTLANLEPDDSGVDIPAMLRGVRESIVRMPRWEVLEEAHIGQFSFAKYLMWRDLGDNVDVLLQNAVVRLIANKSAQGFSAGPEPVPPEKLDDSISPMQLPVVVDADSTQTAAVVAALRGRSFVLQGPPGTGKSQTITNLIAAALAAGKSVLFVSEKMAALEVVFRRLHSVGLGDFCLELHSHKAQKRDVILSLGSTLDRSERIVAPQWDEESRELDSLRSRLNAYARALHQPTPLGMTFHQASARFTVLRDAPHVRMGRPDVRSLTREQLKAACETAGSFARAAAQVEPVAGHPFRSCGVSAWSAQRDSDLRDLLALVLDKLDRLSVARAELCRSLQQNEALSLAHMVSLAEAVQTCTVGPVPDAWRDDERWRALKDGVTSLADQLEEQQRERTELATRWSDALYANGALADLDALFQRWSRAFILFAWIFLFRARKELSGLAVGALPGNVQISDDLVSVRKARASEQATADLRKKLVRELEGYGPTDSATDMQQIIQRGDALRDAVLRTKSRSVPGMEQVLELADRAVSAEERDAHRDRASNVLSAVAEYRNAADQLLKVLEVGEGTWPADAADHTDRARTVVGAWHDNVDKFRPWALYKAACKELDAINARPIYEAHAAGGLPAAQFAAAIERALLDTWLIAARDATPALREFDGVQHHALVERFRRVDQKHIRSARDHVATLLEARLPRAGLDIGASSEPGILRREMAKKRNHMPLRKLLAQIPNVLARLKPCLLMSPLSVAQYLPARGRKFDLIVFDEASQICTHDAIGAIGRGSQVIVVGDSKQLPPTAFFSRSSSDDAVADDNDFTELESILEEARASGLPEQMLGWHYRSRHQDLIEFSNQHYYDNRLNVFPAARAQVAELGVKFHLVPNGAYEAGRSRTNPREGKALVEFLVKELKRTVPAKRTFGVITFSSAQQELLEDLLEEARSRHPEIEPHFAEDHPTFERVFVKNLENVQGDERDEILFSIAYGPDDHGKMLMNFGPLNRDGGERRLNVAVTRARKQLRIFSSITADRIDTNRTRSKGAKHLKAFLRFAAERGEPVARGEAVSGDFDSDFEREVHDFLRASGYRVHTQVGCGGYRIDLAVAHPAAEGVYALGVECDGAAYHSGATARDRDRLRQQVLEGLGWRLHRIWSTDWIYQRAKESQRLLDAVQAALQAAPATTPLPPPREVTKPAAPPAAETTRQVSDVPSPVIPYQRAELDLVVDDPDGLYEDKHSKTVTRLVEKVLAVEAPVHIDELVRRVAAAFGSTRVTARARKRIVEAVAFLPGYSLSNDFVRSTRSAGSTRVVRLAGERSVELIAPEELAAAARWLISQAFSMPLSDLTRETARMFGILRMGAKVEARMRVGIDMLLASDECASDGQHVTWLGQSPST